MEISINSVNVVIQTKCNRHHISLTLLSLLFYTHKEQWLDRLPKNIDYLKSLYLYENLESDNYFLVQLQLESSWTKRTDSRKIYKTQSCRHSTWKKWQWRGSKSIDISHQFGVLNALAEKSWVILMPSKLFHQIWEGLKHTMEESNVCVLFFLSDALSFQQPQC